MNNLDKKQVAKTPLEDWIDNYTVIHMLHISARTLQTLRANNTLPYSRINNKIYYRRQDLQQVLADNYIPSAIDFTHENIIK